MLAQPLPQLLSAHYFPAVFAGAFFFGESVIVTAAALAPKLGWPIGEVALAAFLGTLFADATWFGLGNAADRALLSYVHAYEHAKERAIGTFGRYAERHPFRILLYLKFLYGMRIAMILYLATRRLSFPAFIFFDAIGTALWLVIILALGYGVGIGAFRTLPDLGVVQIALTVFIVSFIGFRLLGVWLSTKQ